LQVLSSSCCSHPLLVMYKYNVYKNRKDYQYNLFLVFVRGKKFTPKYSF
jgi:hypothetical protein